MDTKTCSHCKETKPVSDFHWKRKHLNQHQPRCKPCALVNAKKHWQKKGRDTAALRKYGVSGDEYRAMLEAQGGTCAICDETCRRGKMLCIDHNHTTGEVRGLLCNDCNTMIGLGQDDINILNRAIDYLL